MSVVLIAAFMFLHFEQQNLLTKLNNLAHVKNKAFKQLSCMLSIIVNCALHYSKLNKMRIIWQQRQCKLHYSFTFEGMPLLWQQTFFETDVAKINLSINHFLFTPCVGIIEIIFAIHPSPSSLDITVFFPHLWTTLCPLLPCPPLCVLTQWWWYIHIHTVLLMHNIALDFGPI